MTGDDYVLITTVLRAVRDAAILVDRRLGAAGQVWIPRALLFGGDDLKIAEAGIGCEMKLRLRRFKAIELGLLAERDTRQGRLFA